MTQRDGSVPDIPIDPAPPAQRGGILKVAWAGFGLLCVGLGVIGAVLPLIPTTPFLLLAAFAFARSSSRLHRWLLGHKRFGPLIRNWQRHGAIDRPTKMLSIAAMAAMPVVSFAMGMAGWIIAVQGAVLLASAAFVLSRPSGPRV
ncbi:MAG: YbaN family protein [Pseudomonadota bacterium]